MDLKTNTSADAPSLTGKPGASKPEPSRPEGSVHDALAEFDREMKSAVDLIALARPSTGEPRPVPKAIADLPYSVPGTVAFLRESLRKIEKAIDAVQRAGKIESAAGEKSS